MEGDDFYKNLSRSRVCISLEGAGWDCYRHYESIALGTIPLINEPTMDAAYWQKMPEEIFFKNDLSNLETRLIQILKEKTIQERLIQKLDEELQTRFLWSKMADSILNLAMNRLFKQGKKVENL